MNVPFVTLILPVRNEGQFIARSLGAVLAQNYPPSRMEIFVMDGMSDDDTRAVVARLAAQNPQWQITILDNPGKIVPTGMNLALKQAKGEIIVRVDGHCIIAPNYVEKCVAHLRQDKVDGVGGPMETVGETFVAAAIAVGMSSPFGVGNSAFRTTSGKTALADTVPFPAYTREMIRRAGLYDEELTRNQDDEYNYRIRKLGGKILLARDVRSTYFSRASLKNLWRQYYQYGLYKVRVLQKHPRQMSLRQFIPPVFALTLLTFLILLCLSLVLPPPALRLLSFVLLAYLAANLAASVYAASKSQWKYLPALPIIFFILHFSYGLGFLAGLFKFWNRWGDKTGKVPPL